MSSAYHLIHDKILYNQWVNQSLTNWLKEQSDELYEKEVVSSFSSINKLMHHLMESQTYYLSILKGVEGKYEPYFPTDQLFTQLAETDIQLLEWFEQQPTERMEEEISLKRSAFVETYTYATLLTHVLNHNTYHRGQLVALRHQLGIPAPPRTDYYRYFIARSQAG